ncbi:MAG: TraB/GumN family protein [Dysgonomonas sp.]|nr:TraB/GumN family protein [Dysgonomonas sp.]
MKAITSSVSLFILFLFTLLTASAQDKDYSGSLLWKVSGNGLDKPSYILGTHHLIHVSFVDSISGLKEAIESTDQTIGELVLADQAAMAAKMQQAAMMPTGESYNKLLAAKDYEKLDNGLKSMVGAGLDNLGILKPGMISMLYTITMYTKLYPEFNPMSHEAIDMYVQRVAKEKSKGVIGLETIEDQIHALFDSETLQKQAETLVCSVENSNTAKDLLDKLNAYYRKGDIALMYELSFNNPDDPCPTSQKQQNALAKDRNLKWLQKLPQLMKNNSSLIAVGALHLPGEDGLLKQLAKMGYKVEAVK